MKKTLIAIFIVFNLIVQNTYANNTITVVNSKQEVINQEMSRSQVFIKLASYFDKKIPDTYKYIKLNYLDIQKGSESYEALQKLVYLDLIKNNEIKIHPNKKIDQYSFYKLSERIFGIKLIGESEKQKYQAQNVTENIFTVLDYKLNVSLVEFKSSAVNNDVLNKKAIFVDVYNTITQEHFDNENLDQVQMIEKAVEAMTSASGDKHTVYFPPVDSKDFYESLNGEYQGIGAYVEMQKPGVLIITSPIKGSPTEKSGIKGGDRVLKVDGKLIEEQHSIQEVVSWIKGPAGTVVTLTIQRNGSTFEVNVIRARIIIEDVSYKLLDKNTFFIEIRSFGDHVGSGFRNALIELSKQKRVKKVIIDLRSNGGGYLGEVANMLSYFVPKGEPTAVVKYKEKSKSYNSKGYNLIDFSKYNIVLLQNSGTASASEIMIGTIKDYFPKAKVVGENSYGKGSVQAIRQYNDGSSLKYTIAKWFTGKTVTGIDEVGIKPDRVVEFDVEKYRKWEIDNQLEEARRIK